MMRRHLLVFACASILCLAAGCGGSGFQVINGAGDSSANGNDTINPGNPGSDTTISSGNETVTPPPAPPAAEVCNDGIDNDGNGLTDCADPACSADPSCAPAPTVENCNDGIDNDGNGLTDCADPACSADPSCAPAPTVENCHDGIDNDGNGLTDCADPACSADPSCAPAPTGEVCNDGIDNDGNGLTDCADPACSASPFCGKVKIDPSRYYLNPNWVVTLGPGPVCEDCPGPDVKDYVGDPAIDKEIVNKAVLGQEPFYKTGVNSTIMGKGNVPAAAVKEGISE